MELQVITFIANVRVKLSLWFQRWKRGVLSFRVLTCQLFTSVSSTRLQDTVVYGMKRNWASKMILYIFMYQKARLFKASIFYKQNTIFRHPRMWYLCSFATRMTSVQLLCNLTFTGNTVTATNWSTRSFPAIEATFQNHDVFYSCIILHFLEIMDKLSSTSWATNLQNQHRSSIIVLLYVFLRILQACSDILVNDTTTERKKQIGNRCCDAISYTCLPTPALWCENAKIISVK